MAAIVDSAAWNPRGIEELEPAADWAVRTNQNAAVVAGPGAGKTELLAQRACYLLETGVCPPPRRILAISFKRDAARNLRERVERRAGPDLARRFDSYTFDAFAKGVLDQFLEALPEKIRPTSDYDVLPGSPDPEHIAGVLKCQTPEKFGPSNKLQQFDPKYFYKNWALKVDYQITSETVEVWAAQSFWALLLKVIGRDKLHFGTISWLVRFLIKNDPRVCRAYRSTYSHAFIDEFQDTTELQYALTLALFRGTPAILTVVGDPQQRINGWAGAMDNAFVRFAADFAATTKRLERNRRASAEIAPVVHFLAARLREAADDAGALEVEMMESSGPPPDACGAYIFDNDADEADWLAHEVDALLQAGVSPRDICVLTRMKVSIYTVAAAKALHSRGIAARVEEAYQDLLSEPVVLLLLLAFSALLAAAPGMSWARFRGEVALLQGLVDDDLPALDHSLAGLRSHLRKLAPTVPLEANQIRTLIADHIEPRILTALRNRHAQYQQGSFYEQTVNKICAEMIKVGAAGTWEKAITEIEGANSIPMMTIHKSKGLEYAAVFFVGLEDGAFFGFNKSQPEQMEELNAFFVAISRAKQRVAFTFARRRVLGNKLELSSRHKIRKLYKLLAAAGVPVTDMESASADAGIHR